MQLTERRVGDVTILDLAGKLTLHESADRLKDKIGKLVFRGEKQIIINLAEVHTIDSSGLGELVACYTTAWRGGATVKLANACRRIQDLLVLTKLFTIFDAYDSEAAALESFAVLA
jgi:anti-sigma B factor antagonist